MTHPGGANKKKRGLKMGILAILGIVLIVIIVIAII
jgi:hypothetical protein